MIRYSSSDIDLLFDVLDFGPHLKRLLHVYHDKMIHCQNDDELNDLAQAITDILIGYNDITSFSWLVMKVKDWIIKLQTLDPESHLTFAYDAGDIIDHVIGYERFAPYSNGEYDLSDVVLASDKFAKKFDLFVDGHPCYVVFCG